jgi:hypothetical protein
MAGADGECGQRVRRLDGARVALEEQQGQVLHHDGQAQRDQQDVLVLAMARAIDHHPLQQVAEHEHAGHYGNEGQVRIDPELLLEQVHGVERQHQRRPMGELMMCSTP